MTYVVRVRDPEARRAEIATHCAATANRQRCYQMSRQQDLPVINLDINTPIYRMANYRTQSRQRARIRQHGLPADWFQSGQENELQQSVQHELLVGLANTGSGDTIIPITQALQSDRVQTQPLLITADGVVVNGNRRLAAMRELFADEPENYASFAQIEAQVLPADIDAAEIKRIEVRLQMTPQTLLPYDWTDRAVAVRDLLDTGFSPREVAELMQLREAAVRAILGQLDEADLYLTECAGTPGDYMSIDTAEQHFKEMEKALREKQGTAREVARRIGQAVLHNANSFPQRIYDYRVLYGQNFDQAVPMLADRLNVQPVAVPEPSDDVDDPFASAPDSMAGWAPLGETIADANRQADVAAALRATAEIIIDQNRGATALEAVRRARNNLSSVNLAQAGPETLSEIQTLLSEIEGAAQTLREDARQRAEQLQAAAS